MQFGIARYQLILHSLAKLAMVLFKVNHYIDELAKTQSQLDKLSEVLRRSEQEKQVHERRVNELESNLAKVKDKLTGIKRSKEDERMLNAQLLNDARKREGFNH